MKPIIIVGAGLTGAALALALRQGLPDVPINLLDKAIGGDMGAERPLSLSYGSVRALETLGVWSTLAAEASPILSVRISEQGALGYTRFDSEEASLPFLGQVVSSSTLLRALHVALQDQGISVECITDIRAVDHTPGAASLTFCDAAGEVETRTAAWIAACDGAHSTLRNLVGVTCDVRAGEARCLTGYLTLAHAHTGEAHERFTDEGVYALLPMPQRPTAYRVVLTQLIPHAATDHFTQAHIQAVFGHHIPAITDFATGATFSLERRIAHDRVKGDLFLLGNAAHTIYPLAAQGFNVGLREVAWLAEIATDAASAGRSTLCSEDKARFVDGVHAHQLPIFRLTDGIERIARPKGRLAAGLRGLGLLGLDVMSPMKARLLKQFVGLAGYVPRLNRGRTLSCNL